MYPRKSLLFFSLSFVLRLCICIYSSMLTPLYSFYKRSKKKKKQLNLIFVCSLVRVNQLFLWRFLLLIPSKVYCSRNRRKELATIARSKRKTKWKRTTIFDFKSKKWCKKMVRKMLGSETKIKNAIWNKQIKSKRLHVQFALYSKNLQKHGKWWQINMKSACDLNEFQ